MRSAVILLAIVSLLFVAAGALNRALLFDVDYGFGALLAVSLFWITVVTAAILFFTGLVAALLARGSAVSAQHKLERELQSTYERLREAEARVSFLSAGVALGSSAAVGAPPAAREPRPAPAEPAATPQVAEPRPVTAPEAAATVVVPVDETQVTVVGEPVTTVAPAQDATAVTVSEPTTISETAETRVLPPAATGEPTQASAAAAPADAEPGPAAAATDAPALPMSGEDSPA